MTAKVLVVEDNPDTRDIWTTLLEASGFEVVVAEDGARGVETALAHRPDVILMDYSLPVIDGWEAARRIHLNPDTRSTPVIGITAHAYVADREKALRAGCADFLTKPCEPKDVLAAVRRALKARAEA